MGALLGHDQTKIPPRELLNVKAQGFVVGTGGYFWEKYRYFIKPENIDGHIWVINGSGNGKSSQATSGKSGKRKIFNHMHKYSYGYDPFYLLRESDNPAQEALEIAIAIVQMPANSKDPFWVKSAQNLLTGVILHYSNLYCSFMEIIQELLSKPIDLHVKYICEITKSEEAKYYVNQFERMEQKTLAGIYAELSSNIMVFATDKHIRAALPKKKNISPQDLEENHDIYLSIPEDKLDQWKLLFTLITNQFLKHFERQPDNSALPISFLLDELPRLGKVENVSSALTTLRSKKITICLIIQSLAQLDALYGSAQRRVILDNCAYKAVLNASDAKTQEYFSRLVGTQGITRQGESTNYEPENGEERSYTVSNHIVERRIIKPEDFATLKDVVLITNLGNFRAKKLEPIES